MNFLIVNVTVRVDWVERPTMPLPNGAKTAAEMMRSALFGGNGFVPSSAYPDDPVELRQLPGQFGHVITEEDIEVEAARYRLERALLHCGTHHGGQMVDWRAAAPRIV